MENDRNVAAAVVVVAPGVVVDVVDDMVDATTTTTTITKTAAVHPPPPPPPHATTTTTTTSTTHQNRNIKSSSTSTSPPPSAAHVVVGVQFTSPNSFACEEEEENGNTTTAISTVVTRLHQARQDGYDFITYPIPISTISSSSSSIPMVKKSPPNPNHHHNSNNINISTLESKWWRTSVVGEIVLPPSLSSSSLSSLPYTNPSSLPSSLPYTNPYSSIFQSALEWCLHRNIPAILFPPLPQSLLSTTTHTIPSTPSPSSTSSNDNGTVLQYANALLSCLNTSGLLLRDVQIWIPVTVTQATTTTTTTTTTTHHHHHHHNTLQYLYQCIDYHPSIYTVLILEPMPSLVPKSKSSSSSSLIVSSSSSTTATAAADYLLDQLGRIHVCIGGSGGIPPLAALQLPTTIFMTNARGFPTLSRTHQAMMTMLLRRTGRSLKILISTTTTSSILPQLSSQQLGSTGVLPHYQYIQHVRNSKLEITSVLDHHGDDHDTNDTNTTTAAATATAAWSMEKDYYDVLQSPLQPLTDHLEYYTYEIFEQDPVKYVQYQTAMYQSMIDFWKQHEQQQQQQQPIHTTTTTTIIPYIVLVVGAGRGPLVTACIQAYTQFMMHHGSTTTATPPPTRKYHCQLYLYAIEKNPHAIDYLQSKFDTRALQQPTSSTNNNNEQQQPPIHLQIVQADLRYLNAQELFGPDSILYQHHQDSSSSSSQPPPPPRAHLIVSELLGSFGCNELSPECLDTLLYATDVCDPHFTQSIPQQYVSHVTPIASMKLYQQVKQQALYPVTMDGTTTHVIGFLKAAETPYVVRPFAASQIYPTQDCWSFVHGPVRPHDPNSNSTSSSSSTPTTTTMRNSIPGPNHDRYVHLEFPSTATTTTTATTLDANGALYGNGYGGYDDMIQNTITAILDHHHSSPAADQSVSNLPSHHHQWLAATDNTASSKLPWTCTGLLGTFTADLYAAAGASETIQISTHPQHFSQGMFSWFPIYFPSIHPIYVPANAVVYVDLWRKCTHTRVWYEWSFTVALATGTNGATSTTPPPTTTTTTANNNTNNNNNNVGATIVVDATTGPMEVDGDDPTVGGRNTTCSTKYPHQEKEYTIIYVSPIHNPGGRSSFVSVV
jgi:hypothetical protein